MIDATYRISPDAQSGLDPEKLMQELAQTLNQGRDVSVPEDVTWISNWVKQYSKGSVTIGHTAAPAYQEIVACVNRGHVAIGAFGDYINLRLVDGSQPYDWNDPHGLSHLVLIVGYDDETQAVVVHDPLRPLTGQPADYSWKSFQAAQFYVLSEVNGPSLLSKVASDQLAVPTGWQDDGKTLRAPNGVPVVGDFRDWVLTHTWDSQNWPLIAARQMTAIEWGSSGSGPGVRQDFRMISLGQPTGKDVYEIWVGQDILALAQQLDASKAQIDQLQRELDQLKQLPALPPQPPTPTLAMPAPAPAASPSGTPLAVPVAQATPQPAVHKTLPAHPASPPRSNNSFQLLTLFQRARSYLPLTPVERAFLKFLQGAICAAIVAAASIVYQGFSQHLDWGSIFHTAMAAGATALLFTLNKYFTAHLDPALEDLVSHFESAVKLPTPSSVPPIPIM